MTRLFILVFSLVAAAVFGFAVSPERLALSAQPLLVALSIMAAGMLVRLNRGMPGIDWTSLSATERTDLTRALVDVARDYLGVLLVLAIGMAALVLLTLFAPEAKSLNDAIGGRLLSGALGATIALCFARMGTVVWRDYDIIVLQKRVLDGATAAAATKAAGAVADEKVATMRSTGMKRAANGQ